MDKLIKLVFTLTFLLFLTIPSFWSIFANRDNIGSIGENRYLEQVPDFKAIPYTEWTKSFDKYLSDNIAFRDSFISYYILLWERKLKTIASPHNFYTLDNILFSRTQLVDNFINPMDFEYLKKLAISYYGKQLFFESLGINYILAVMPEKYTVYPEWLPKKLREFEGKSSYYQYTGMFKRYGVDYIDLNKVYQENKSFFLFHNKIHDPIHYNGNGAYYFYLSLFEKMGISQETFSSFFDVVEVDLKKNNSIKVDQTPYSYEENLPFLNVKNVENLTIESFNGNMFVFSGGGYLSKNSENIGQNIIFMGDCYSQDGHIINISPLAHYSDSLIHMFYNNGNMKQLSALVNVHKPAYVVEAFAERARPQAFDEFYFLGILGSDSKIMLNANNDSGYIEMELPNTYSVIALPTVEMQSYREDTAYLVAKIESPKDTTIRLFYSDSKEQFFYEKSVAQKLFTGINYIALEIPNNRASTYMSLVFEENGTYKFYDVPQPAEFIGGFVNGF